MDEKIKHFVEEIKSYLIGIYKERIKQVILYGSYARGDATEDSDIDLLLVEEDGNRILGAHIIGPSA